MLKVNALIECYKSFVSIAIENLEIWKVRKENIDIILENFDYYLLVISCYIYYAAPLSYNYRKLYKEYLYSLSEKLNLKNIKKLDIYSILLEVLDSSNKDNEFCSSIGQYNEFLADNFTMMYVMNNKIPYLIDNTLMSPDIIATFLELKTPKVIVKTTYNDINEQGEMLDKIETSMKNGSILFIEQCEEGIYDIMENLIENKFIYNKQNGKNCYIIKNKKIEKNPKFKLHLIKSKPNSKISPKAFDNCYIINFNCPKYIVNDYFYKSICKEQNPLLFQQVAKTRNDRTKDQFRLLELEKKLLNYNRVFDLSYNLDKLDYNQNLLDKFKIEKSTHSTISKQINNNKIRLEIYKEQLKRYECISKDGSEIYKLLYLFFDYDVLYMIPIEYLSDLLKEYYKIKFENLKEPETRKKSNKKEIIENEKYDYDKQEEDNEIENDNDYDDDDNENYEEKDEQRILEEQLKKQKSCEEEEATYKVENAPELVIFLYNKISQIYDTNKQQYLLLILLFFGLRQKEEIPYNFKKIIQNVYKIYFNKNLEETDQNKKNSPISHINVFTWKCLIKINDCSSYIFTIILDHIEKHPQEWDTFLDNDELLIERKFNVFDEDLSNTINPFTKFLFFSIVKTYLSDSIISTIINDIINNENNPFIVKDEDIEQNNEIILGKAPNLEELFFTNINITRKPIIIIDKQDGEILYQKDIKELYLKKLKQTNIREDKENIIFNDSVNFKEISPSKLEFTNNELDSIHSSMKTGGVIFIKNCYSIKESIFKLIEEINDKNITLNENFKLILFMNNNNNFPKYLYSKCNFINRDILLVSQMKVFIIDLIEETPIELFNQLMNSQINNICSYYLKKLYIFFTIIYTILIQYSAFKPNLMKIPINYSRKEYFFCLEYIIDIISSLIEEKQKELQNVDNIFGFTYESVIEIITDIFIYSKLITKNEYNFIKRLIIYLFENSGFMKNETLFAYNEFILMNIDEKKYPINSNELINNDNTFNNQKSLFDKLNNKYCIPKSALLKEFEKIPNEIYYILMYGISKFMYNKETEKKIKEFYEVFGNDKIKKEIKIKYNKININYITERLDELKRLLPDLIYILEANSSLFKLNKYNELLNPLDECLKQEINSFNLFLTDLYNDINNLMNVIKGNRLLIKQYYDMIRDINNNIVPKKWKLSKFDNSSKCKNIDSWIIQIKYIYEVLNKWLFDGFLKIYDLSIFSNDKLFITLLPIYFQKRLSDSKAYSSDRIKINFKLTKYENNIEITDEIINEYKAQNNNQDFIFIKGLRLKGFEGHKEKEKYTKSYKENLDNPNGELLPIIAVSYTINEFKPDVDHKLNDEEESEDEEVEEEEITMNQQENKENIEKINETKIEKRKKIDIEKIKNAKTTLSFLRKVKIKYYKKHCKLEIPFIEQRDENVYNINEPYGYIEIRIDCDKYRQEEYFINKNIVIVVDK